MNYPLGNTRTNYIMPDSVTTITAGSFRGCSSLELIRIPYFGTSPSNDMSFDSIFGSVPKSLKTLIIGNACDEIPENVFASNNAIETIEFGTNIKKINANALTGLSALKNIIYNGSSNSFKDIIVDSTNDQIISNVTIDYKN